MKTVRKLTIFSGAVIILVSLIMSGCAGSGTSSIPTSTSISAPPSSPVSAPVSETTVIPSSTSSTSASQAALPSVSEQPIKIRITSGLTSDHPWELALHRWAEKIQSETGGRVEMVFIDTSSSMGGVPGGMPSGKDKYKEADLIANNAAMMSLPMGKVLPAFFYGTDVTVARKVFNTIWQEYPEISKEYTDLNIVRLFGHGEMSFNVQSKFKAVRTLEDFNGMKICVLMGELNEVFNELGATEVPLSFGGGFYSSVDDGSIGATLGWVEGLETMGGIGIIKYSTDLNVPLPPQDFYEINPEVWKNLPADVQKVFENNNSWIEEEIDKASLEIDKKAQDTAKAGGVELIQLSAQDLDKFNSLMEARAMKKATELDAKNFPGTKIFERTRDLIQEYAK
jgi:TRAP-type C4-dicarboxylate transport system substrate-binding protein